jgi:hypothetical protein
MEGFLGPVLKRPDGRMYRGMFRYSPGRKIPSPSPSAFTVRDTIFPGAGKKSRKENAFTECVQGNNQENSGETGPYDHRRPEKQKRKSLLALIFS